MRPIARDEAFEISELSTDQAAKPTPTVPNAAAEMQRKSLLSALTEERTAIAVQS